MNFRKSSPELHGVYYKMQGYSQTRKYKKKNNSPKVNVVEIMKSGRRILLKPKKERVEDLQFKYTSQSNESMDYNQVVNILKTKRFRNSCICFKLCFIHLQHFVASVFLYIK